MEGIGTVRLQINSATQRIPNLYTKVRHAAFGANQSADLRADTASGINNFWMNLKIQRQRVVSIIMQPKRIYYE